MSQMIGRGGDGPRDEGYFRVPVRLTRADLERLDHIARENDVTLGYYLDLLVADAVNEIRRNKAEPIIPSPFLEPSDPWRQQRPRSPDPVKESWRTWHTKA